MSRSIRFAPVSGAPSMLIGVAGMYFMLSAALAALLTLVPPLLLPEVRAEGSPIEIAISVVLGLAWAAGMFWTGVLLGRGLRRGAYLATGLTVLSFLASPTGMMLAFTVLSFIVLASIWRDLKQGP